MDNSVDDYVPADTFGLIELFGISIFKNEVIFSCFS